MCPHRHAFHLLLLGRSCRVFAGKAESPAEHGERPGPAEDRHAWQAGEESYPPGIDIKPPPACGKTNCLSGYLKLPAIYEHGCRLQKEGCLSVLCCGITTALPSTLPTPRPLEKVQPHLPGPQPLKMALWHIAPAAQLDACLLHFSGYNSWVGKLAFFSCPSAGKVREHLQGMQPLCAFTRRVPRTL